jgi:hypothetical protein
MISSFSSCSFLFPNQFLSKRGCLCCHRDTVLAGHFPCRRHQVRDDERRGTAERAKIQEHGRLRPATDEGGRDLEILPVWLGRGCR